MEPSAFASEEQEVEQVWDHFVQAEEMEFWAAEPLLVQKVVPPQRSVVVRVWELCAGEQIPLPHRCDDGNGLAHHVAAA